MGRPDLGADHADRRGARYSEQLERFYYRGQSGHLRARRIGHDPKGLRFDASSVPNAACRHTEYRRPVLFRSLVWSGNFSLARECGQFAIVIAFLLVVFSFIALRVKAPEQSRPFRVPLGIPLGIVTLVLTLGLLMLYLPGSPAALLWPEEWGMVLFSIMVGAVLYRKQSSK